MSTSRLSLIGLPESIDSRTANSRDRSCRMRAIRNRYLARSLPARRAHFRWARRALRIARSMSAGVPFATAASGCSVAGSTLVNVPPPVASTSRPPMNKPVAVLESDDVAGLGRWGVLPRDRLAVPESPARRRDARARVRRSRRWASSSVLVRRCRSPSPRLCTRPPGTAGGRTVPTGCQGARQWDPVAREVDAGRTGDAKVVRPPPAYGTRSAWATTAPSTRSPGRRSPRRPAVGQRMARRCGHRASVRQHQIDDPMVGRHGCAGDGEDDARDPPVVAVQGPDHVADRECLDRDRPIRRRDRRASGEADGAGWRTRRTPRRDRDRPVRCDRPAHPLDRSVGGVGLLEDLVEAETAVGRCQLQRPELFPDRVDRERGGRRSARESGQDRGTS